jgi:hypothetical protein
MGYLTDPDYEEPNYEDDLDRGDWEYDLARDLELKERLEREERLERKEKPKRKFNGWLAEILKERAR